jgi:pilus assembly protein Flp/PilA
MMRGFEDKALVFERVARRVRRCRSQNRENGQTMVEYALLITFIALVALVAIKVLGSSVSSLFDSVASSF